MSSQQPGSAQRATAFVAPRCGAALRPLVALLVLLLVATTARAGFFHGFANPFLDLRPIEDQLEIVERERELLAVDASTRRVVAVEIERGEWVEWQHVRGRVALAITNRRVLAAVAGSSHWAERALRLSESEPVRIVLGDRVALVATDQRVLGFEGISGSWSETELRPREHVLSAGAGTNVAVAVTRLRVLGVAALAGGLFEQRLGIREDVHSLKVHGSFATVTTRLRLLTFRSPDGSWQATNLDFR